MPDAVDSVQVREGKSAQASMICIHDLKGLIALVQLGALEFHPWGSSAENPERPDRMIFDLDPGEGVMWEDIIQAAREFRNILTALELAAFVRTTGGKGLHVVCPLSGDVTWGMLKQFAAAVAREVATAYPERYVASMSKKSRNGRIFIDHFRNARGATAIASYSTRARPGAPVATPLSWSELNASLDREHLTATRLPRRLAALRDDPWSGFRQVKQSLSENALRALRVK